MLYLILGMAALALGLLALRGFAQANPVNVARRLRIGAGSVSLLAAGVLFMRGVGCQGGLTQIGKVLTHTLGESRRRKVNALVYVGDSMEEDVDRVCAHAGELALLGVPVFVFQEGSDETAGRTFREVARLTKGAFCRFDPGSARQLRDLLTAVAVYAAGGRKALLALSGKREGAGARLLLEQLNPGAAST